jgi:hypothetical protein
MTQRQVAAGQRLGVLDPVGARDHLRIMLDHDHVRAGVDEPVQQRDEPGDVAAGKPGRLRALVKELDEVL